VKKIFTVCLWIAFLFGACATYQPPSPTLYVGNLPQSLVTDLTLDERIIIEDAWKSLKQGQGNKAKKSLSKLNEQNPFYYVGMGYAYFMMNDLDLAEDFFKAAERYSPDMNIVHLGLAQIYHKKGQEDLAFAQYREVLKIDPDHSWAVPQYESLKIKKTQEFLEQGRLYLSSGKTESSRDAFLKALYYSPESSEAHLALADIFLKEDNFKNALIHLEAASKNDPENFDILKKYGEALFHANMDEKSLDVYQKLAEEEPENQEYKQRIEILKNRLGIFELPSQYNAIIASEAISKEQMTALLAVKFKDFLEEPSRRPDIIIDIATSWASDSILQMTSLGLLDIYPNHTFRPKKIITRAEMAEILLRLVEYLKEKGFRFIQHIPPERIQISDVLPDNYYYQPIIEIVSYDIMGLSMEQTFKPDVPVSGQEAIKFLDIILSLVM
jgi:Tfp pilus assembly protein PilF